MSREQWDGAKSVATGDLKPGDVLIVDDGFPCVRAWSTHVVTADKDGALFFECEFGSHYLCGQDLFGHDDPLVGVRRLQCN